MVCDPIMDVTSKSQSYRADIDGIRALAVLAVVIYHAVPEWIPGGFTGVDIFFVISGYLITKIIFSEISESKFSFVNFYLRRIRRIFPALIITLALCLAYGWLILLPIEYQQLGLHAAASSVCIQNFLFWKESGYFDSAANLKPLLHLWSLAVEEQFYIFFPPLLLLITRSKKFIIGILFVLIIASFAANVVMSYQNRASDFFITTYRAWELLAGCVLAVWHLGKRPEKIRHANLVSSIGAFLIIIGIVAIDKNDPFPGWRAVFPVLGAALLIRGGSAWINRKILSHPVAVWVGLISYPLYLFHWPIISYIHVVESDGLKVWQIFIGVLLSFVLAAATYYLVERRNCVITKLHGWFRHLLALFWRWADAGF